MANCDAGKIHRVDKSWAASWCCNCYISALLLAGMRGHLDLGEHPLSKTKPLTSIKAVCCG
jgi:hypothetical protein